MTSTEHACVLVVGATGQLGGLVVRALLQQGRRVRALVRDDAAAAWAVSVGAEPVRADLRHGASLQEAVQGSGQVVCTANTVAPRRAWDTYAVHERGVADLVGLAEDAGVQRIVLASVPVTPLDEDVPELRLKRAHERRLERSPVPALSVRLAPFTEVWLALVGSAVPLRGEEHPTLARPYGFLRTFRRLTGTTVEDRGRLVVPGPASSRNAFLSVHDAATALVHALDADLHGAVDLNGPEALSWTDVAQVYARVLGRPVGVVSLPVAPFAVAQRLLTRPAPGAANVMGMNRLIGTLETTDTTPASAAVLVPEGRRTVAEVLADKALLAGLPT